jgi:hypothetical protein
MTSELQNKPRSELTYVLFPASFSLFPMLMPIAN